MRRTHPPVTPGIQFGLLTVLERIPARPRTDAMPGHPAQARCTCQCGNEYTVQENHLYIGRVTSCAACRRKVLPWGARQRRIAEAAGALDRVAYRRLIGVYSKMMDRCHLPTCPAFSDYGARGIAVCDEWRGRPDAFVTWAITQEHHNNPDYTLDRINNDGGYEPANCRFATWTEQANNRRNNVIVCFRGERMTASQFGRAHCPEFSAGRVINWLKTNDLDTEGLLAHYQRCTVTAPG